MKFAGPAQDNCGRAVRLPSQKARSALVYLTSTDLDSVEEGAPAKRRRISSVGVITDEVQKRLLERLSKGYLGAYLWESGIRGSREGISWIYSGALYGQAVLQGMSRAYESVLEEANRTIVEFRLRATTPASSAMTPLTPPSAAPAADLLVVAESKAVPPASGVSGHGPAFNTPEKAFSLLSMSSPAMPDPVMPEGVFGPMPVGGAMRLRVFLFWLPL